MNLMEGRGKQQLVAPVQISDQSQHCSVGLNKRKGRQEGIGRGGKTKESCSERDGELGNTWSGRGKGERYGDGGDRQTDRQEERGSGMEEKIAKFERIQWLEEKKKIKAISKER